ncbi:phosphosulfolactate synthase [Alkalitalea saponilacus]|uniref:Phosphosulfolactate synthase n=1 Tax=Alkalitalea saponilacus TaxID=889453 RepID=A0A1T5HCG0_9BACT|nr:phosphosulfolactate synthase [Alkalitalea saponilacus]ASB50749.1 phosphosulfolactate synthase [Alkalitalea saponilacus]SKC18387.1 phosphosulfolactate synthase [Alkalitalea saponilacus]
MNFNLPFLPERTEKPRVTGVTMMTDKGLSVRETESFCEGIFPYTDFVKMAFGTSLLIPSLESKLNIYKSAEVTPVFGGTLFELFFHRQIMDEYRKYLDKYGMEYVEISEGTISITREEKLSAIMEFSKNYKVISQTTGTLHDEHFSFDKWTELASEELSAGASMVIVKESEQMPVYGKDGLARYIHENSGKNLNPEQLIWDSSEKKHQIELINLLGNNVNLCNITPEDIISLETKRLGLHSSTLLKLIPPLTGEEE